MFFTNVTLFSAIDLVWVDLEFSKKLCCCCGKQISQSSGGQQKQDFSNQLIYFYITLSENIIYCLGEKILLCFLFYYADGLLYKLDYQFTVAAQLKLNWIKSLVYYLYNLNLKYIYLYVYIIYYHHLHSLFKNKMQSHKLLRISRKDKGNSTEKPDPPLR